MLRVWILPHLLLPVGTCIRWTATLVLGVLTLVWIPDAALKSSLAECHIAHQRPLALIMRPTAVTWPGWVFVPVPPYSMNVCSRLVAFRATGEAIPVAAREQLKQSNLTGLGLPALHCLLIHELLASTAKMHNCTSLYHALCPEALTTGFKIPGSAARFVADGLSDDVLIPCEFETKLLPQLPLRARHSLHEFIRSPIFS